MKRNRSEYEQYTDTWKYVDTPKTREAGFLQDGYYARAYMRAKRDIEMEHDTFKHAPNPYSYEIIMKAKTNARKAKKDVMSQYKQWHAKRKLNQDDSVLQQNVSKIMYKKWANRILAPKRRMTRLASMRRMSYAKMPVPGLPGHKRLYNKDIPGIIEQYYMTRKK